MLVGSTAKNTSLNKKADIDIFITFPLNHTPEQLKEDGLKIAEKTIEKLEGIPEKKYASHPYLTGHIGKYTVDFVPCYNIKDATQLKSAVDRTTLHTKYIKEHMTNTQADQVLLLKQFMTTTNTYGAKYKVSGFSGYLTELLILKYNTFQNTIDNAVNWKKHVSIDLENYGTTKKFKDPLIAIDPTDSNRNVAAALSNQKLSEFIIAAQNYQKNPTKEYFKPITIKPNINDLKTIFKKRNTKTLILSFNIPTLPDDTIYPQINKTQQSLIRTSKLYDFEIFNSTYWITENKAYILLEYEISQLPNIKKHTGPQIYNNINATNFKIKHPNSIIKENKYIALIPRKYTNINEFIIGMLKKEEINQLKLGKDIKETITNDYQIEDIQKFMNSTNNENLKQIHQYLHPTIHITR